MKGARRRFHLVLSEVLEWLSGRAWERERGSTESPGERKLKSPAMMIEMLRGLSWARLMSLERWLDSEVNSVGEILWL